MDRLDNTQDIPMEVPITNKEMENLLTLQQEILGKIAIGKQYQDTLNDLCRTAESMLSNSVASIMLFDDKKESLVVKAAPNIPIEAINALNGLIPGEHSGSCGTAVFKGLPQFVCDTREDIRWSKTSFQDFASAFGIDACWSMPIRGDKDSVIGSFALSSMEKRKPHKFHKKLLETCAGIVAIILKREAEEEKLHHMAHYDELTQLPNRILFSDRFTQAVAHSKRTNNMLAVCFLDLDNFKPVNDNYGHEVGDKLLIEVAARIKKTLREEDTVSRQGGDEFALLLGDIASIAQCEEAIGRILKVLAQPYLIDDVTHKISASIGISIYPLENVDLDTLIRHADQAMYLAKLSGKNQQRLFSTSDHEQTINDQGKLQEIKQALAQKDFQLYFQPKVNMKTGEVFGTEALIRWIHPEKGLIPPLDFLPFVGGSDLEIQIGGWVINEALKQLNDWQQQGIKLEVSINISSHHLQSTAFFDQLNEALDKYPNVSSQSLQLEILESSSLGDIETISGIIKSCQNVLGVKVALDDFGTGYSSLTHMKNLSADTIKIDQTFVRDLLDDPNDYSIIEGIIGLAKAFNREVIAEGVETTNHGLMLLVMGCSEAQGYGISRPLTVDGLVSWLADYKPNKHWIDYGNRNLSLQEQKILLLQLTTEHWFNSVNKVLLTMEDSGFGQYFMKCHLGEWLSRFEDEKIFNQEWLEQLKQAHDALFSLARHLVEQHLAGKIDEVREGIEELKTSYSAVFSLLNGYSQHSVASASFAALSSKK